MIPDKSFNIRAVVSMPYPPALKSSNPTEKEGSASRRRHNLAETQTPIGFADGVIAQSASYGKPHYLSTRAKKTTIANFSDRRVQVALQELKPPTVWLRVPRMARPTP